MKTPFLFLIFLAHVSFAEVATSEGGICENCPEKSLANSNSISKSACELEMKANNCDDFFAMNKVDPTWRRTCEKGTFSPLTVLRSIKDLAKACDASVTQGIKDSLTDMVLLPVNVATGIMNAYQKNSARFNECENDPNLSCKKLIAQQAGFLLKPLDFTQASPECKKIIERLKPAKVITEEQLRDFSYSDLLHKRDNLRHMSERDQNYAKWLQCNNVTVPETATDTLKHLSETALKTANIRYQCYNSVGYVQAFCYGVSMVAAPSVAVTQANKLRLLTQAHLEARELKALNTKATKLYDRMDELNKNPRTSEALAEQRAKTAFELEQVNARRFALKENFRKPDASPNARRMTDLESRMETTKNLIRETDEKIAQSELALKYAPASDQAAIQATLEGLKTHKTKLQSNLNPLQKEWDALEAKTPPEKRVKQLTGKDIKPGELPPDEMPDPDLYFKDDGSIEMYASGSQYRYYANKHQFLRGEPGELRQLDLRHPNGDRMVTKPYGTEEASWDMVKYRLRDGTEIMYGGSITPKRYRAGGKPSDPGHTNMSENWTRSGHAFVKKFSHIDGTGKEVLYNSKAEFMEKNRSKGGKFLAEAKLTEAWVKAEKDIMGRTISQNVDWDGHNYGRRLKTDENGQVILDENGQMTMEIEMAKDPSGKLGHTELYELKIDPKNPTVALGEPKKTMGNFYEANGKQKPYDNVTRSFNRELSLTEGPTTLNRNIPGAELPPLSADDIANFKRKFPELAQHDPAKLEWEMVGLSADDYASKFYVKGYAVRPIDPAKPYTQQLDRLTPVTDGTSVKDFAKAAKLARGESWGPARPNPKHFGKKYGDWEICHAVDECVVSAHLNPQRNPRTAELPWFHRNGYLSPIKGYKWNNGVPEPIIDESIKVPVGAKFLIYVPPTNSDSKARRK